MKKITLLTLALTLSVFPLLSQADEAKSVASLFPAQLEDAEGKPVDAASLKGKTVAIYFSAHWCPPCRMFTPSLVEFHKANKDKDFEIVFVSLDNSDAEKKHYIEDVGMEWLTVAGSRSKAGTALAEKYEVRGIPMLVVLAPDGSIVTTNGRGDVSSAPETALAKWKKSSGS